VQVDLAMTGGRNGGAVKVRVEAKAEARGARIVDRRKPASGLKIGKRPPGLKGFEQAPERGRGWVRPVFEAKRGLQLTQSRKKKSARYTRKKKNQKKRKKGGKNLGPKDPMWVN